MSRIYLSSTYEDLKEHREAVAQALRRLGHQVIGMEDYVAADQRALAKCLEDVGKCHVYVGVFAWRYGYVPDEGNPGRKSITELEYRHATDLEKPRLVFLLSDDAPWPPKFVDKGKSARLVNALRDDLGQTRLASFFKSKDELAGLVGTAITNWEREQPGKGGLPDDAGASEVPPAYLDWVRRECGSIELLGLRLKQGQSVRIGSVYVPLTTTLREEPVAKASRKGKRPAQAKALRSSGKEAEPSLLLGLVERRSLYVSGAPGSGKSTFCRWLAWLLAAGVMPDAEPEGADEAPEERYPEALARKLPVLIRLRDFHGSLPEAHALTAHQFEGALARWLEERRPGGLTWRGLQARLGSGEAVLMFDGADEVPASRRSALFSGLAQCLPAWEKPGNRILLTSRPYGVSDTDLGRLGLSHAPLADLAPPFQARLVRRWFRILAEDAEGAARTAAGLLADLRQRPWLVPLAENPLLLTAMCIVYGEGKRLPQDRHELYDRIVDTVLHNRFPAPEVPLVRNRLAVIAHGMHTGLGLGEERETPEAQTTEDEIDRLLEAYQHANYTEEGFKRVNETRDQLLSQSGLLLPLESRRAAFYHLSFQEFLAAERTADVDRERLLEVFRARGDRPEWRNTLSFLYGSQLANNVAPRRAVDLLLGLLAGFTPETRPTPVILAADAIEILRGRRVHLQETKLDGMRALCQAAMRGPRRAVERCAYGEALGRIGDPRFRADAWFLPADEMLGFVEIPAGPFLMGSDESQDRQAESSELPQSTLQLPTYFIARYPVTVAQFRAFVEDQAGNGGFRPGDSECLRGVDNHPVVLVSWHEALAYCRWLTAKLSSADLVPERLRGVLAPQDSRTAWCVTLPSEAQWEKAARGIDGRIYPWGNEPDPEKANYDDTGINTTSTVGCFPAGASPFKIEEMSGNVWEWTRSLWGPDPRTPEFAYPYQPGDGRQSLDAPGGVLRVLRGGSWANCARLARGTVRDWDHPDYRGGSLGFRVVASPLQSTSGL
jgi:formylglycine-generating enzyme required for sulfatase activity